jgi:hypothetical protein
MKTQFAFVTLVALVFPILLASDSASTGRLAGVVTDSEGAVIANAIVLVHWAGHGADAARGAPPGLGDDLRLSTDKAGQFSAELAPGFYDVAVFATAFSPQAFKVRLRVGETTVSNAKLVVDPLMCKEFCEDLGTGVPEH